MWQDQDDLGLADRVQGGKKKKKKKDELVEDPAAKAVWRSIDKDGNGRLDQEEVRMVFAKMERSATTHRTLHVHPAERVGGRAWALSQQVLQLRRLSPVSVACGFSPSWAHRSAPAGK